MFLVLQTSVAAVYASHCAACCQITCSWAVTCFTKTGAETSCTYEPQVVITPRMLTQLLAAHGGALFGGIPRSPVRPAQA
jgi:hypothetical protein